MRHFHVKAKDCEAVIVAADEFEARQRFEEELFPGYRAESCDPVTPDWDEAEEPAVAGVWSG